LALKGISLDHILSSAALRAQITTEGVVEKIGYEGSISYMDELYLTKTESILNVLSMQESSYNSIMLVGHNPAISELANLLQSENISKFPTLGILKIDFEIESWHDILDAKGKLDFFIFPKQFKYYIPREVRATLNK